MSLSLEVCQSVAFTASSMACLLGSEKGVFECGSGGPGQAAAAAAYASTCSSARIELEGLGWSRQYCAE